MGKLEEIEIKEFSELVKEAIHSIEATKKFMTVRADKLQDPNFIKMIDVLKINLKEATDDINEICDNLYIDEQLGHGLGKN